MSVGDIQPKFYHVYLDHNYECTGSRDVYVKAFSKGHAILPFSIDGWVSIQQVAEFFPDLDQKFTLIDMTDPEVAQNYEELAITRSIAQRRRRVRDTLDKEEGACVFEVTLKQTGAKEAEVVYVRAFSQEQAIRPFNNEWLSVRHATINDEAKVTVDLTGAGPVSIPPAQQAPGQPSASPPPEVPGDAEGYFDKVRKLFELGTCLESYIREVVQQELKKL